MMYGICEFNIEYDDKPKRLVKFETYEKARKYYIKEYVIHERYIDDDIWIVWIDGDKIIQFEQFIPHTRTKTIQL